MGEEANKCQLCEEIKKDNKFPKSFADLLNAGAFVLICGIIILFFCLVFPSNEKEYKETTNVKINLTSINNSKLDSVNLNKTLDLKIKEFEEKNKSEEKERNENMKYYGTLVGFILSIVGFFGFKSVHDTRQIALDAVKIKSEEVAKKITSDKIGEYVNENVKIEIDNYLNDSGKKYITDVVERIAYDEAERVAKNTTLEEFNRVKTNLEESRLAFKDDLESIERDRKRLLKRIQDLEKKIYPDPDNEEEDDDSGNDNDSGDDSIKPIV